MKSSNGSRHEQTYFLKPSTSDEEPQVFFPRKNYIVLLSYSPKNEEKR